MLFFIQWWEIVIKESNARIRSKKKPVAKLQDLLLQARILRLAEKGIFMIRMFYRYGPWETRNYESSDILQEI